MTLVLLSAMATLNGAASVVFFLLRTRLPEASAFFGASFLTVVWGAWLCSCGLYITAALRRGERSRTRERPLPRTRPAIPTQAGSEPI